MDPKVWAAIIIAALTGSAMPMLSPKMRADAFTGAEAKEMKVALLETIRAEAAASRESLLHRIERHEYMGHGSVEE